MASNQSTQIIKTDFFFNLFTFYIYWLYDTYAFPTDKGQISTRKIQRMTKPERNENG